MLDWLQAIAGAALGFGVIVGVFWFTFGRPPSRHEHGGTSNSDAVDLYQNTHDHGAGGSG